MINGYEGWFADKPHLKQPVMSQVAGNLVFSDSLDNTEIISVLRQSAQILPISVELAGDSIKMWIAHITEWKNICVGPSYAVIYA